MEPSAKTTEKVPQIEVDKKKRLHGLRNFLALILGLLYLQFELGMETNLANPPSLPPIPFSIAGIFVYLGKVGGRPYYTP